MIFNKQFFYFNLSKFNQLFNSLFYIILIIIIKIPIFYNIYKYYFILNYFT